MLNTPTDRERLLLPIKLSFPVIHVDTFELSRAADYFKSLAKEAGKHFVQVGYTQIPKPTLIQKITNSKEHKDSKGTVMFDPFFFERAQSERETRPALKASLSELEKAGINYIIAGIGELTEEFVSRMSLPPLSVDEIIDVVAQCEHSSNKIQLTDEERRSIATNMVGLSHTQIRNLAMVCFAFKSRDYAYLPEIQTQKAHLLRSQGLDVMAPVDMGDVGGLENLKHFLEIRKSGWDAGLPLKGVIVTGVPGGGKTLIARAAAGYFGTSLIRLRMEAFYSKYLGETETKFARALQTIDQVSPVTILIDEIEKYFGRSDGGSHEVSSRLLGTFLQWLQNRTSKSFIVATCNRVDLLPPELLRAGRWDRSFFVDLPNASERHTIFDIHLQKHGLQLSSDQIDDLVSLTDGYTGAEIEQIVIDGRFLNEHEPGVDCFDLLARCVTDVTPTSQTRPHEIQAIRSLGEHGFYPANKPDSSNTANTGRSIQL